MPISDVASLVGGAALGAPVSEIFKLLIEEAKKVKDFKPLSHDLASTMERLTPIFNEIDSMQEESNPGNSELKDLIKTMRRAEEMVRKCSRVQWYSIAKRALYTREIKGINQAFLKFCQIELQFIQHRNQLQSMRWMASVSSKIDLPGKEITELFLVPQPEEVTVSWLDRPLRELKEMLFEDGVVTVVVSAPSACGKTLLVTKLCHDADVKGKFNKIFFITVSKAPNIRLIVQRLLQHTACKANESDAMLSIQQLMQHLGQSGSVLLVLDDVWPEEASLLQQFLIQLTDYKILVTSRFEFSSFGPTFRLETLIGEDVKNLFIECTPQPNCLTCAKRDHLLQKILKRCNGLPLAMNPPCSTCEGCNIVIEHGRPVNVLGALWHPECFCCDACHEPIAIQEVENHVSNPRGKFHKSCYKSHYGPDCIVCKEKIPSTAEGIKYNEHPFWKEKYCPSHEVDGTPKCCSCERLEPRGKNYAMLGDGRFLCLECMETSIMDTHEVQPLHFEIREFFEGLFMKVEKEFPLLLVEYQALNEAVEEGMDHHPEVVNRALCLSETQIISSVSRGPRMGPNRQLIGIVTETQTVSTGCEVTAILIIYGLPKLLTGYMLAHEMMHAWLRLNGYRNLNKVLEEGICQMLGYMWLESQTYGTTDAAAASSKKGDDRCDYEKKLLEFCMYQIKEDDSPVYGLGFNKVDEMMLSNHYNLKHTLKDIVRASKI